MKSTDLFRGEGLASNKRRTFAFHVLWATVIFLSAAALRVWQLGPSSLWFDDAWVALVARMSAGQLTQIGMTSFGFQVILWIWLHLVGFSEVRAQLIPLLAGCLGPVAVYVLAVRKRVTPAAGIIAALLLVVAPMHVQYSATVKQYTSEALLTVFLVWLAWTVLENPRRKNLIGLGAAACFSVFVSSIMIFVAIPAVCIPAVWTALRRGEHRLDCIVVAALTLVFVGAWIPLMAPDAAHPALRQYLVELLRGSR